MGRLMWHCCLLITFLYVHLRVDCTHDSDQKPFNSSSHHKECSALLQLKNTSYRGSPQCPPCNEFKMIHGLPCSRTDYWMEDKDCCSWLWVSCDGGGHVTELFLDDSCLKGTLNVSVLLQLPRLERLQLAGNMLSGQIPDVFSNLRRLNYLDLSGNNFSGPIPHSLCELPNLIDLSLSDNILNGEVPSCLFRMRSLLSIDLANNHLTAPTSQIKGNSSVLKKFYFGNNRIRGPIPSSIFEFVNLTELDLSSNNLTGPFKFDILSKFRFLTSLDLSGNSLLSFSFEVRDISSIGLEELRLSSCNISEFPTNFLSSLENLTFLDLSNNRIHGKIFKNGSEGWASLTEIKLSHNFLTYVEYPWDNIIFLFLDNNRIQGSLLVPPPKTRLFIVSNNNLTGNIPPSFCNWTFSHVLDLSGNNLGGEIPKCLESLINGLDFLHLQNNIFQGSIPDIFLNSSLVGLDVSGNNLEGPLPRSLNSCTDLQIINVGNNKISDIFPHWLGTLPHLEIVILKSNQFYGKVPDSSTNFPALRILDLSGNKFTGHLSIKLFGNLEGMMSTREEENVYMGPECSSGYNYICEISKGYKYSFSLLMKGKPIDFEKIFKDFRAIDLSNNLFEGSIPDIFGKFQSLTMLNLSHNSLTGKIPLSVGNMTALESLDLSSNNLDGRIPEQMESLTFLAVLNLSYNRLSGHIPEGGQFSTYESDSFVGNKGLCGKPLSKKCNNDLVPSSPPYLQEEDHYADKFSWKIAMLGYGCGLVIGLSIGYFVLSTQKLPWLERIIEGWLHKKVRRPGRRHEN